MGAVYNGFCHDTAAQAAATMCGNEFPRTSVDGNGEVRVQTCSSTTGSELAVTTATPAQAASAVTLVPVSFSPCDPDVHYREVAELWGAGLVAVVLVMLAYAPFRPLRMNQ